MKYIKILIYILCTPVAILVIGQIGIYIYVDAPLQTYFYGSIPKELVQQRQAYYKVKSVSGNGWIHLGWIADPDEEDYHMTSRDGIHWNNYSIIVKAPFNKFFRDCMIVQVSPDQWLMYTTARGKFFSQIDVYQSFNLIKWQYIRTALESSWGSERNSPFASMESPFVVQYNDHYYLSLTNNNDTLFIHGILLLLKIWLNKESYNDTLVFHSDNPYDFSVYKCKRNSPTLLTTLKAHAPEWTYEHTTKRWYITTCCWPWVATLTSGEVAIAPVT